MEFNDDAKSECTELPVEYKPSLFTNSALSQSKVSEIIFLTSPDINKDERNRMLKIPSKNSNKIKSYVSFFNKQISSAHIIV